MNLTIKPGAATDDAAQIQKIVSDIETSLDELNQKITGNIPSGVDTDWSEEVLNNWNTYYSADVPQALADMTLSATNLNNAVDAALKYSNEQ